jgi:dihydroneopterin aldolase
MQDVFDYDRVSSIVVEEGTGKPYKLLERFAARLLERLLASTPATRVRVAVTKLRPPTQASVDAVTVELTASATEG